MKKILSAILIVLLFACNRKEKTAEIHTPSFKEVVNAFFSSYTFVPKENSEIILFAKMKNGWYVTVVDQRTNEKLKSELFWRNGENKFLPLQQFPNANPTPEQKEEVVGWYLGISNDTGYDKYGYERCFYYGYEDWDKDMIEEFGNTVSANDTLMEGLGRAYSSYAGKFIQSNGYGMRPSLAKDPLKKPLGLLEKPTPERIEQFTKNADKAIQCYETIAKRNPSYQTLVGNAAIKLMNEQFHKYQVLLMTGYTEQAERTFASMHPTDSLYSKIGRGLLRDCPPNSILFSNGDNDSYPLWYVQQKEGYRSDVSVLNLSLFNLPMYVDWIKKNNKAAFVMTEKEYGDKDFFYFVYDKGIKDVEETAPLTSLLKTLYSREYAREDETLFMVYYPYNAVSLAVDTASLPARTGRKLTNSMEFRLGQHLILSEVLTLDIIQTNFQKRPICFTAPTTGFPENKLEQQGILFRLLPRHDDWVKEDVQWELNHTGTYLENEYDPVLITVGEHTSMVGYEMHERLFASMIENSLASYDKTKAKYWAKKYLDHPATKKITPSLDHVDIAEQLAEVDYKEEAKKILEDAAENIVNQYFNGSSLDPFRSQKSTVNYLEYLQRSLKDDPSEKIDKLIKEIGQEN